jgi:large conductance mechanosensitive channel
VLEGFKKFILRGNVVDMAVGVVVGAAFGGVVTALTRDLLTPLIAAVVGKKEDFSAIYFTIRGTKFPVGDFINAVVSFLLIAATVYFFVVTPVNALLARMKKEPPPDPTTRKCPECLSEIPVDAKRCAHCAQLVPAGRAAA